MPRLSVEQLEARRKGMGTTDVIQALGYAPWEGAGPMTVYVEKLGLAPRPTETDEQRWGHEQEPVILAWYEREVEPVIAVWRTVHHPKHEWLFATLDAYAFGGNRNIEVKSRGIFGLREGWNDSDPTGVPQHVRVQVNIGMSIREAPECAIVASICGAPPKVWIVPFDAELDRTVIHDAQEFWAKHILERVPPELDDSSATRLYLQSKYPRETEPTIVKATAEIDEIGIKRAKASGQIIELSKIRNTCDAQLLDAIGLNSGIQSSDRVNGELYAESWKMTWKTGKDGKRRSRFTVKGGRTHDDE